MLDNILFLLCTTAVFIWLSLLLLPARWRITERWEAAASPPITPSRWPSLSVIVPARNERNSLPETLPSWLKQDYPYSEIIIVDDESNDGTAEYVSEITTKYSGVVRILKGTPPPPGWTGKLWALEQGIRVTSGEWILFTDADILHSPNLWKGLVAKAINERRFMVSLMALLDTNGMWSRLLIPAFVYFFHILYPFEKVCTPQSKIAAAAGGCILMARNALEKIGGIAGHRDAWIDDIALAKRIKQAGMSISLSLSKSAISVRPYPRLNDIWNMVARTAFTQLNYSWLMLFGTVCGMVILFLSPIVGILGFFIGFASRFTFELSIIAFLFMAVSYLPILRFYGLNIFWSFTLPLAGILYMAMTVTSAYNHLSGKRVWRGVRN